MYGYIYITIDHLENKVYIGQHKSNNAMYFGSGKIIQSIIRKRKHSLEKRILGYCETKEELNIAEQECIAFFNSFDRRYGYNLSLGGESGSFGAKWADKSKEKLSQSISGSGNAFYGKKHSFETKQKISKSKKGKPISFSEQGKANIKNKRIEYNKSEEFRNYLSERGKLKTGANNNRYGIKWSEEQKTKYKTTRLLKKYIQEYVW